MRISRKMEHVEHALNLNISGIQGLADVRFIHNCLPETAVESINLSTTFGELQLSSPIVINAMTGGAVETEAINRELAAAARNNGLAMAVGSQMSAIKNPEMASSYRVVRTMNPNGLIFANLGSEASVDQAKRAVDMLEANAIQIHLNVMQELIMPEGDRDFRGMLHRMEQIVKHIQVPVIVKEVGFGIMGESARKLKQIGITMIDVGGMGGTNFAAIENARRSIPKQWLNDWGGTTATALIESLQIYNRGKVMASGGISNGLEAAKALAIGATAVGMAGTFLRVLQKQGAEALNTYIGELHNELKMIMTAVGAASIPSLWNCPLLISGATAEWCQIRGMDTNHYARKGFTETT